MENKMEKTVLDKFIEMIETSWTYNKMNKMEKKRCIELLRDVRTVDALKYTDDHKWTILQAVYNAYLQGLGYDGPEWRGR